MKFLLIAIGVLMILATVLPFLRKDEWWIRIFDFPRLQITLITAVVIAAYLPFRGDSVAEHGFLVALILCLTLPGLHDVSLHALVSKTGTTE